MTEGSPIPMNIAMMSAPRPENTPLTATTLEGPVEESRLVQLFSRPQQRHAATTASEPGEKDRPSLPTTDSRITDSVMTATAAHILAETLSPNMVTAITVVATISKLFKRETDDAGELSSPYISRIGAAMSRSIIATTYGRSPLENGASSRLEPFAERTTTIPIPAPRYSSDAMRYGETSSSRTFDTGELIA